MPEKRKNPKRVAPQIRRSIEAQKIRVRVALGMGVFLLAVVVAGFWVDMPTWIRIMAAVFAAFSFFGAYADHGLRRIKEQELVALQQEIDAMGGSSPPHGE